MAEKNAKQYKSQKTNQPHTHKTDPQTKSTVFCLIWFALGILTLLSFFGIIGIVGIGIKIALSWAFGIASVAVPAIFFFFGVFKLINKRPAASVQVYIGCLYYIITCLISVFSAPVENYAFGEYIKNLQVLGLNLQGGGVLSGLLIWPFSKLLGQVGTIIVLIFSALIFIVLVSGFNVKKLQTAFSEKQKDVEEVDDIQNQESTKNGFHIPQISNEDKLSSKDKEHILEQQKKREEELNPESENKSRKHRINIPKPEIKVPSFESSLSSAEIDAKAFALMEEQKEANSPEPKITKEDIEKETKKVENLIQNDSENLAQESYQFPSLDFLKYKPDENTSKAKEEMDATAESLMQVLSDFSINTTFLTAVHGPTVTRYELQPNAGVKISKITGLADDIALRLAASGVRIEAPIPGRSAIGIEIPNKNPGMVYLKEIIASDNFQKQSSHLAVALGKDISGEPTAIDLAKMPHLLIAGSTGSGKSVCINSFLMSLLYHASPNDVKMILVDPKVVELSVYNGIPHLLIPVVTEPTQAAGALQWAVNEMLKRYKAFAKKGVRNFAGYNEKLDEGETPMTQIVIVIDELADLMMASPGEVEDAICRLAQMARAAGMHLIIATQRPSADVLTGLIKVNIPSRIAFAVTSSINSRIILDSTGAEKLIGHGDMLYCPIGAPKPTRLQGCFVSDEEIERVVTFLKKNHSEATGNSEILDEINKLSKNAMKAKKSSDLPGGTDEDGDFIDIGEDTLLPHAVRTVIQAGVASTSGLQRALGVGHSRAGRLMDQMEKKGYIGPYQGSKPREVLITMEQWDEIRAKETESSEENEEETNYN